MILEGLRRHAALECARGRELLLLEFRDNLEVVELRVDLRPQVNVSVLAYLAHIVHRGASVGLILMNGVHLACGLEDVVLEVGRSVSCVALRELGALVHVVAIGRESSGLIVRILVEQVHWVNFVVQ